MNYSIPSGAAIAQCGRGEKARPLLMQSVVVGSQGQRCSRRSPQCEIGDLPAKGALSLSIGTGGHDAVCQKGRNKVAESRHKGGFHEDGPRGEQRQCGLKYGRVGGRWLATERKPGPGERAREGRQSHGGDG